MIGTAKLFLHGGGQVVRLPKEFGLPGTDVRVWWFGRGALLEPMERDAADITAMSLRLIGSAARPCCLKDGRTSRRCGPC